MRGRWPRDCAGLEGLDPAATARVGEDLLRRWTEPHRHYHGVQHLAEVLAAVDLLCTAAGVGSGPRTVALLGAWFHDAVYDVVAPGANEPLSARLAEQSLRSMGVAREVRERVSTVVLDTAEHDLPSDAAGDAARTVLHDADLWVLAAPLTRFDEYCAQVRAEYAHVPVPAYAAARSRVLRVLLGRPHLYTTAHARRAWEEVARENLARELTRLAA